MSNPAEQTSFLQTFLRSKGLPIALLLSLIINIGLFGFLAGRWNNAQATPHMPPPSIGMGRFLHGLEETRRDELKPYLSAHFDTLRPNIRAGRKAHRAVRAAIAAEPFAPEVLEQMLFTLNSNRGAGAAEQANTLAKLVEQLSSDERAKLANSLKRSQRYKGRRNGRSMRQHRESNREQNPELKPEINKESGES